jgi:alpha-tubulin suppressor-like RCC1 family protein
MENNKCLLVLGNNYDGCLMTGDTKDVVQFTKVTPDFLNNLEYYKISTGLKSVAIYSDKHIIIVGRFADEEVDHKPRTFTFNEQIIDVSCGDFHILILTDNGEVYSYGKGLHGELGLGEEIIEASEPKKLELSNISKVYAGVRTSFFIDSNRLINIRRR